MNKKIVSAIALGVVASQFSPYLAYALPNTEANNQVNEENNKENVVAENKEVKPQKNIDWSKEYPNLINPDKKDMKPISFSPEITLELGEIINLLDEIEKDFSMEKLNGVFDRMFKLNTTMPVEDVELHDEYDQIDYIMYKATYYAFTNTSDKERDELFIKLADDMYLSAVKRINSGISSKLMTEYGAYYGNMLKDYFKDEKTKQILNNLNSMLMTVSQTSVIPPDNIDPDKEYDFTFPEDELPSNIKAESRPDDSIETLPPTVPELPPVDNDIVIPDDGIIFPDNGGNNGGNGGNGQNGYNETEEYIAKGNSCYKITTKYDFAGNELSKNEVKLPSSEKGFCNIYDYEVIDGNTWNQNNNGDTALDVWESLGLNELNKLSNYSIHFSINKNNEKPYYYDSGIRLSTDMTATYTQIRDVLNQIALKTNGYVIEDTGKLLFIAEGKPLVVKDKKAEYSKSEIESLLNSFTEIGMKVDTVKQFSSDSLEDQANKGELREIAFGDETITLTKDPIVEGSILKLPIEEVATKLGLKVEQKDNKLLVTNDTLKFEYEIGTKNVSINGTTKILSTASQSKDNVVYGEMNLLIKELGYTLKFDSFAGKIEILK